MKILRSSNVVKAEITSVIHVHSIVGTGDGGDPARGVDEWFNVEGNLIARHDSWVGAKTEGELEEKERADRLEAMIDRMAGKLSDCALLILPLYKLCLQIEKCGASEELTQASVMASDVLKNIMDALEIKELPPSVRNETLRTPSHSPFFNWAINMMKQIPIQNMLHADRYDTDTLHVIHLWDDQGHSFDFSCPREEFVGGKDSGGAES